MEGGGLIIRNLKKGVRGFLDLLYFLVPVYSLVFLLKRLGVLEGVAHLCQPYMAFVGLPGEASLPLILGNLVNLYAAIGAIAGLSLGAKEITIVALMLLFSHSQVLEGAVMFKVRSTFLLFAPLRFLLSVFVAHLLHPYIGKLW